jgi:hypothetical protein
MLLTSSMCVAGCVVPVQLAGDVVYGALLPSLPPVLVALLQVLMAAAPTSCKYIGPVSLSRELTGHNESPQAKVCNTSRPLCAPSLLLLLRV